MKVLITGVDGFLGQNLKIKLAELKMYQILEFDKQHSLTELAEMINQADFIFHFAGANRPKSVTDFAIVNVELTQFICDTIASSGRDIPIVFSSSIQSGLDNPYGQSKQQAEGCLLKLNNQSGNPVFIYQLSNAFGKWSRPNYNSAVVTFCYNIGRGLPININDENAPLRLVYIDDIVESFIRLLQADDIMTQPIKQSVTPEYNTTVGEVAKIIYGFKESIKSGVTLPVGLGLIRALYATYLSYLPTEKFAYPITQHADTRGIFVEMLKTPDSGQFAFFTLNEGLTRGEHYHHTKSEKFLVMHGTALYRFRHIITHEYYELKVDGEESMVVETIPGWSHDITNIGNDKLIVMLWANEIFDRSKPDTTYYKVKHTP